MLRGLFRGCIFGFVVLLLIGGFILFLIFRPMPEPKEVPVRGEDTRGIELCTGADCDGADPVTTGCADESKFAYEIPLVIADEEVATDFSAAVTLRGNVMHCGGVYWAEMDQWSSPEGYRYELFVLDPVAGSWTESARGDNSESSATTTMLYAPDTGVVVVLRILNDSGNLVEEVTFEPAS